MSRVQMIVTAAQSALPALHTHHEAGRFPDTLPTAAKLPPHSQRLSYRIVRGPAVPKEYTISPRSLTAVKDLT